LSFEPSSFFSAVNGLDTSTHSTVITVYLAAANRPRWG
jgi:hypothetical protein